MGQVLLAGKEPQEWPALLRDVIADCPLQRGIARLERVQDRPLGGLTLDLDRYFAVYARQRPQVCRKFNADHGNVWTSTETTAGTIVLRQPFRERLPLVSACPAAVNA